MLDGRPPSPHPRRRRTGLQMIEEVFKQLMVIVWYVLSPRCCQPNSVKRFDTELSNNHACCRFALMYLSHSHDIHLLWDSSPLMPCAGATNGSDVSIISGRTSHQCFVRQTLLPLPRGRHAQVNLMSGESPALSGSGLVKEMGFL